MIYVFTAGLLVPLKPGILGIHPSTAITGSSTVFEIETYNSNFLASKEKEAWLKIDNDRILKYKLFEADANEKLKLHFDLPSNLPLEGKDTSATLILFNELDGVSILPDAVFIKRGSDHLDNVNTFSSAEIRVQNFVEKFRFPYRNILVETIRNTFFHVAIWMSMFAILVLAMYHSIQYLRTRNFEHDIKASSFANVGIVYGLIGIATGSVWAKYTWGAFWTSDVKLNMAAIAMLIYLAYWILRGSIPAIDTKARLSAMYNIFAFFTMIPLLLILPRMTDSLHPGNGGNPALGGEDLDNTLRMVFYPAIIGLFLLGRWMAQLGIRTRLLEEKEFQE